MAGKQLPVSDGFQQMLAEDAAIEGKEPAAPALFAAEPPLERIRRFQPPEPDWRAEERERAEREAGGAWWPHCAWIRGGVARRGRSWTGGQRRSGPPLHS
jgi:hypothetical protein